MKIFWGDELKKHWPAVALAFLIAIITAASTLFFMWTPGYRGIPLMHTDTESYYLSRINGTYAGCLLSCNPFIYQEETYPSIDPSLSPAMLALPGIIFGFSVVTLKLLYEFLLPFIFFLLVYGLFFRIVRNKIISITGTLLIICGYNIVNSTAFFSLSEFISVITLNMRALTGNLLYARLVNPGVSSIIFFIFLHQLFIFYERPSKRSAVTLSLLYGFAWYVYFYTYTFSTVLIGLSIITFLIRQEVRKAFLLSGSLVGGIIIGIPIIYNVYSLVKHPFYEGLYQYAVTHTHRPDITLAGVSIVLTFSVLVMLYKKKVAVFSPQALFVIVLVITSFVVKNQQIISGTMVEHFHYDWYYITPVFILLVCFMLSLFKWTRCVYGFLVFICLVSVTNGILIQVNSYTHAYTRTQELQAYMPVLTFLQRSIPSQTVVIAPSLEELIPMYTHLYNISSQNTDLFYLHSTEQSQDRKNTLISPLYFERAIATYKARYLVLSEREYKDIPFNIQPYIKNIVYKDTIFTVYELIS